MNVVDVFMLDSEFKIERPTRYYRTGLNLLHPDAEVLPDAVTNADGNGLLTAHDGQSRRSFAGTIRSSISRVLHPHEGGRRRRRRSRAATVSGHEGGSTRGRSYEDDEESSSESSSSDSEGETRREAMLDPSTHVNPIPNEANGTPGITVDGSAAGGNEKAKKQKKKRGDVSKHTFYVENSQVRLKLFARNERQMLQWMAAFEKIAASSHFMGGNRFDSFAPIRLNVAAQWLVDGVSSLHFF
jgi:phospholipase D1/2